jgi:hypothetical protein
MRTEAERRLAEDPHALECPKEAAAAHDAGHCLEIDPETARNAKARIQRICGAANA